MDQDPQKTRELSYYYALTQIGFEMALPVGLAWWIDQGLGIFPWITVLGTILGLLLGFTHLILLVNSWTNGKPPKDRVS